MANENMIQKHEDNFLAKIAGGATPVDTNVRNSKEFWLNKIADWTGGKSTDDASTKKIYIHPIILVHDGTSPSYETLSFFIFDDEPTAYDTWAKVKAKMVSVAVGIGATARFPFSGFVRTDTGNFIPSHCDVQTGGVLALYETE